MIDGSFGAVVLNEVDALAAGFGGDDTRWCVSDKAEMGVTLAPNTDLGAPNAEPPKTDTAGPKAFGVAVRLLNADCAVWGCTGGANTDEIVPLVDLAGWLRAEVGGTEPKFEDSHSVALR